MLNDAVECCLALCEDPQKCTRTTRAVIPSDDDEQLADLDSGFQSLRRVYGPLRQGDSLTGTAGATEQRHRLMVPP